MINTAYFTALILVSLRLIAFFIIVPVFFPNGTPQITKITLSLIMAYILMPGIDFSIVNTVAGMIPFVLLCMNEVIAGLTLGFITNLCFMSVRFAGNIMDIQIGFSMMTQYDPTSNSNTTLLEHLLYWFGLVVFLLIDGHHMLIRALVDSFNTIKLGQFYLAQNSINSIMNAFVEYFDIGLKIAIPIVLILIIADLTMGLVARTVPQLNIMILNLPIKILVGMAAFSLALPIFLKIITNSFYHLPDIINSFYHTLPFIVIFASEEKTEEATPRKKSEARKKGQVAKSKEVGLALTLLACTIVLLSLGQYAASSFEATLTAFLNNYLTMHLSYETVQNITLIAVWRIGIVFLPIVVPIMLIGVFANFLQTGFILSKEPLKPDFSKLNPLNGFKRMFSMRSLVELIKDLTLVIIVGFIGYGFVKSNYMYILNLWNLTPAALFAAVGNLILSIFFRITLLMIAIAIVDYVFQRFQFNKDLRMTKQEIKEEFKQDEGDPQIKSKIRQKQRQMAMSRMMQEVPKATVVVANPTHIAVALKYEEGSNAPKVTAKGLDYLALKIKQTASENEVPVIENKPLARLLYDEVDIDSEIPVEMYQTVAELLAYVYKIKKKK